MASRNQYTHTPGYGGNNRHSQPRYTNARQGAAYPSGLHFGTPPAPRRASAQVGAEARTASDTVVLTLLLIVVPLFGLLALFVQGFRWVFLIAALGTLVAMLAARTFAPRGRMISSGVLIALITVAAIGVISPFTNKNNGSAQLGGDPATYVQQPGSNLAGNPSATAPIENAGLSGETALPAGAIVQDTPAPTAFFSNEAETVMNYFMQMWRDENYEDMVRYVKPLWRQGLDAPARQLSWQFAGWKLNSWEITPAAQSDTADAMSLTVNASLTKDQPAKPQYTCKYDVLLFNVDGQWYVDPDSMRSVPKIVDPNATPEPSKVNENGEPTVVNPTTQPSVKLWYNPDGGTYYHADQQCKKIDSKYYSKMQSFEYGDIKKHSNLKPCPTCKAPK